MTPEQLTERPTEIELAELTDAASKVLTESGMNILRRALFQLEKLEQDLENLERDLHQAMEQ